MALVLAGGLSVVGCRCEFLVGWDVSVVFHPLVHRASTRNPPKGDFLLPPLSGDAPPSGRWRCTPTSGSRPAPTQQAAHCRHPLKDALDGARSS